MQSICNLVLFLVNFSFDHKIVIKVLLSFILITEAPPEFTNHVIYRISRNFRGP